MWSESLPLTHCITLPNKHSEPVHIIAAPGVSHSHFWKAINSSLFKQWLHNLQTETGVLADVSMALRLVLIQGVDMFGKRNGFLKFKADIYDRETGKKVPGIVFARGPAVAALMLLESEGEINAVLAEELEELFWNCLPECWVMTGDFVGTAIREVEEEIGIKLKREDMIDLIAFMDDSTGCRVFPSPEEVMKKSVSFCTEEVLIKGLSHSYTGKRLAFENMGS